MGPREFEQELEKRVKERTADLARNHESLTRQLAELEGIDAELKDARARLQHVLAVTPAIIYTNQASGDFACTFVSDSLLPIMGYAPQEMLDDPDFWTTHLHPQDARHVLADVFRLIGQSGGTVEYRFRHRDGHYRWFQDTFKVIPDAAGHPYEIVGSWADITQRKLAEAIQVLYQASLQIQEPLGLKKWFDDFLRKGREVLHVDRLSILLADQDGQWLRAVASTETDQPLDAIRVPIATEGGGLARAYLTREAIIWDGQAPPPEEYQLRPPYDQIDAFRCRMFAIMPLVVQGQAIGVLGAGWKYPRRAFEPATLEPLHLLATQAALALEHARLYAAAQPVLRRSLELTEVYPAFAEAVKALLGYDRIGVVVPEGERLVMALSVAEPPLASWQGESWPNTEGTAVDWVMTHKDPRLVRDLAKEQTFSDDIFMVQEGIRATLMLPLMASEKAVGVFFLDSLTPGAYTERDLELVDPVAQQLALAIQNAQLFREIEEKGRQIEIASHHKSQFLANMSHELRTPLNAILGYTALILDNIYGDVPEKIRDVLQRLEKSGHHLLGLINDVLDISKIEAGLLTLSIADYCIDEVVQIAVAEVESLAAEKQLTLEVAVPGGLPRGRGDARRITQVLLNLIGNAIKFTETGKVRVEVGALDGAFRISVADTGPGIAQGDQEKIFEEFHQADSSSTREKGGTGLGLSIARRIIELHRGRIWVESKLDEGSTFWVTLPLLAEPQEAST
ncbi:MAG: GAF domain-containing protein [Betaproteobacteria bacterium]|nr:GAF domain-containing protein [Betaproteobacteria bacterium]